MRNSLTPGKLLPESYADFLKLMEEGQLTNTVCVMCEKPFTPQNVESAAGWAETQISGNCETCFDEMFAEDKDEEDGEDDK